VLGVDSSICVAALTRRNLSALDENELFMELIRDVANELDINVLCHKILVNVELLTHADRGSLFLARGPRESRYLVAKLFDVTVDTGNKKQQFHILCVSPSRKAN
jgi:cGMP-specific 3',5'-cyclic phosphodiesterase, invertebrate